MAQRYSIVLVALSSAAFAASNWFVYRAGCVGDVKAASYGDPVAALALEDRAAGFFLFGIILAVGAVARHQRISVGWRIAIAGAFVLIVVPGLWFFESFCVENWCR